MSLRARQPRGSSRLPVCSCTRTQTHSYPHCTRSHSVYPSSHAHTYILTSSHAHLPEIHIHTCTGFQALAAVIQDQFLPCKYSRSPRLLFITLQCYSEALAHNACLALFRPFCNIRAAQSPSSFLLGLSIVMLGLATSTKHI